MPRTLLLADDSVTIQKVVGISFANEDVVLLTVDNGDDAIRRARETRPDVVLADVVMPGKSGYEVCEAIKRDPQLAHVPVLLLTGTFEPFDEERASRAGADGHITKPFEAQALVDQVNALFAKSAAAASAPAGRPQPVGPPGASQAYDFFEDDLSPSMPTAGEAAAPPPLPPEAALELDEDPEPLELEAAVEDDLAGGPISEARSVPPPPPPAADWQPGPGETDFTTWGMEPPLEAAPGSRERVPAPPPTPVETPRSGPESNSWGDVTGGGPFSLDFMQPEQTSDRGAEDPLAQLGSEELGAEAVLDPEAARAHEVSSSDLGATPSDYDTPTARPYGVRTPARPPAPAPAQPAEGRPTPEPSFADVPLAEPAPFGPPASRRADEAAIPESETAMTELEPVAELEETGHGALAPEPSIVADPERAAPVHAPGAPTPPGELRQRMHESIEKVAWEAFGDLSERIVREVVERVEAVAWEVIPQVAESLIREEIQRLQNEDSGA